MRPVAFLLAAAIAASPACAEPPNVATDIPPVHALVARVMQGVGEPAMILPPGASPHGYAMRPSEAAALAAADLVVWVGPALTRWLAHAIEALAPGAASLELLDTEGTTLLAFREGIAFEKPEADQPAEAGQGQAVQPAGHDEEAHEAAGRDHDQDHHDHGNIDPHAWLDPENARIWLGAIAEALARTDPANAAIYARNAAEARSEIDDLVDELSATVAPVRGRPFIVFHDGYHYFEHRFGIEAASAIAAGDAAPPGPARVAEIRDTLARTGAACVFAEPQLSPALIETVLEGTHARAAMLDPLGTTLTSGPMLYPELLRALAAGLHDCLGGQ